MMYISKQNKYYIRRFDNNDWSKPYLDFNDALLEKMHTDQIDQNFISTIESLQSKYPESEIKNRSRNSMCCYMLWMKANNTHLSIWISFAYPCYTIMDFSSFDLIRRKERPIELVEGIEEVINTFYWEHKHMNVKELQKLNSFPVGYLKKESTISHVVFGGEIGMW